MDGEVYLLWHEEEGPIATWLVLHGVFLTASMANRRRDEMEDRHGGVWKVQSREVGVLGEMRV